MDRPAGRIGCSGGQGEGRTTHSPRSGGPIGPPPSGRGGGEGVWTKPTVDSYRPHPDPPPSGEGAWRRPLLASVRLCVFAFLFSFVRAPGASPPQRIVCLAPSVTEMVFALGAGAGVVGVSDFCSGPAEALTRPRVGGFTNPNYERILALQPDLVLTIGEAERLRRFCVDRTIPCRALTIESVADVGRALTTLGALLARPGEAAVRVAELESGLAVVRARVAGRRPVPTLLVVARAPGTLRGLMTTNGATFLSELLTLAGGRNCFAAGAQRYFTPSQEAIFMAAPEAIVELQPATGQWSANGGQPEPSGTQERRLLADWQALPGLPAVQAGRLYVVTEPRLLIPGLHMAETAARLADLLHPETAVVPSSLPPRGGGSGRGGRCLRTALPHRRSTSLDGRPRARPAPPAPMPPATRRASCVGGTGTRSAPPRHRAGRPPSPPRSS